MPSGTQAHSEMHIMSPISSSVDQCLLLFSPVCFIDDEKLVTFMLVDFKVIFFKLKDSVTVENVLIHARIVQQTTILFDFVEMN